LHSTITSASFYASASFHFSSVTLSSISNLSQNLLSTLDAILGSTESSRAIAAIITLIRREFRNLETGDRAEKVGVGDLLVGAIGFALLQRWGRRSTEREIRENGGEDIVWDVVILDNGVRADVIGTQQIEYTNNVRNNLNNEPTRPASFLSPGKDEDTFDAVERGTGSVTPIVGPHLTLPPEDQHQISDEDIRLYIMRQLSPGTRASIRTETVTARTITVDIFDDDTAEIAAPPGTMMIEERFHHDQDYAAAGDSTSQPLPRHTVVFRTAFNRSQSADLRLEVRSGSAILSRSEATEEEVERNADHDTDDLHDAHNEGLEDVHTSPDVKSPVTKQEKSIDHHYHHKWFNAQNQDDYQAEESAALHPVSQKGPRRTMSSSSLSSSETPKNTFGKSSFSKIAQKVKPTPGEKPENDKKLASKKGSKKSARANSSATLSKPSKARRDTTSDRNSGSQGLFRKSTSLAAPTPTSQVPAPRPTSALANRNLPKSHLQDSSRFRSTPSPTPSRLHPRDVPGRTSSRTDYYAVHEKNRESYIAQTDTYSLRSVENRPGSSTFSRTHLRSDSAMSTTHSEKEMTVSVNGDGQPSSSHIRRSSRSFVPSIYSLATGSQTSLILAPRPRKSVYDDHSTLVELNRNGRVPGIFPDNHLVQNIRRFCRFSTASYGPNALKVMGISEATKAVRSLDPDNHEHSSFSDHTGLPPSTILLSSFVDPDGGSNADGETGTGFPLVHYLCLDHDSKAVVLTLRGTWGFEDVLTDMTCDYDDLEWQGRNWKVHKGMHASARRLFEGGGGKVMATLKAALEEFPDYGVVLCGHSLGGGVAALLATMISEPNSDTSGPSFVTASSVSAARPLLLTANQEQQLQRRYSLPAGRPIHVYAYGPPAVMSPFLRRATRGLITTVINGQDVVPSLSLGVLQDIHSVSLAFKSDTAGAKSHVRSRVWESLKQSIVNKFYVNQPPMLVNAGEGIGNDTWAWKTLKMLRADMVAPKLVPPGEVFVVETMRVLQRDAFTSDAAGDSGYPRLGRPATRVQFKFIRNVEERFGEVRFGSGMLGDHNPARYEASLAALAQGVED